MINVYIDGACSNNGKEDAKAGYGVYFGKDDKRNECNVVLGKQTNNTAELTAFLRALEILEDEINNMIEINIYIDSEYVIKCATTFGKKLAENDWKTSNNKKPPNVELVKKIYELYSNTKTVKLHHIDAHTNNTDEHSLGNKEADKLANKSIGLDECPYVNKETAPKVYDNDENTNIVYINVPFADKNTAKENGARWDVDAKKWYYNKVSLDQAKQNKLKELFPVSSNNDIVSPVVKKTTENNSDTDKTYIQVSFDKKDIAKKYGARWDASKRSWYYTQEIGSENISKLKKL